MFWYYSIQYLCVLNWTLIYDNNMFLIYLWVPKVRWKIWIFIVECSNDVFSSWCCWDWAAADLALLCVYWYIISVTATILWDHYDLHETMDRLPIFVILLSIFLSTQECLVFKHEVIFIYIRYIILFLDARILVTESLKVP